MSRRRLRVGLCFVLLMTVTASAPAAGAGAAAERQPRLEMYTATVDAETLGQLVEGGFDVTTVEATAEDVQVALVLSREERDALRKKGVRLRVWRDRRGRTQSRLAALQEAQGFQVFRPYDGPDGIEAELRAIASTPRYRGLVQLYDIGDSHEGRDILAIRMTQGARGLPLRRRPAVLYQATVHAREWISTEVGRRLLHWYLDRWAADDPTVKAILETTELWFVPVVNPDGYQYTFDTERLWRKNLRDNDGDGVTTANDGVDLNRNLPEHWNYDEEGSSSQFSSQVYRGPAPASEPETKANMSLFDMADLRFAISYHSFGQLLLYPQGWQTQTPSADDPIYVALTGTDDNPAVEGFDPDLSAELYTTNGEFTDWAHGDRGVLAWTPELSEGCPDCGFVFPDDEQLVQEEFERNLEFAVNVARSAPDPDDPVTNTGIDTQAFYLDTSQIDPFKTNNPLSDLTFDVSYAGGGAQPVDVLAKRSLGAVTLRYRINGGPVQSAATSESPDGEVFGGNNAYNRWYHYLRGQVPGLSVGDTVEYWFTAYGQESPHATFSVAENAAGADVLVVAAEDRTGIANLPAYDSDTAPNYLDFYTDALKANDIDFDVYDVDARGRIAPDHLGVLSHYDAVIWYSANDLVTREQGWGPGNVSRLANDLVLEARQYLNEGGSVLYTGQWAGALENGVLGTQFYDPVANERCVGPPPTFTLLLDRCQVLSDKNDFLQYYLGAYVYNSDAGTDPDGNPFDVVGVEDPYTDMRWGFNGGDSADNQVHTASLLTTSSVLKPDEYPQFASRAPAVWDTGAGGGFEPFDGDWYMFSQAGDISYKRLARTIDLTGVSAADAPTLTFRFSYDTEIDWDFVFVEAHTVGQDDWTTLPDANGHTNQATGSSCPAGWHELHPWLERYQGADCSGSNPSTGGEWHAHSGRSDGWEEWQVDLSAYAGSQAEVSISYASDWAVQGLGAFVDQVVVSTGEGSTSFEEDADPMDGWTVPGPPPGSAANPNDWLRTQSVGFDEGAVTATDATLYFGFGFEGITGADARAAVMDKSIGYLLD